jgi:hypothetical protein
MNRLTDEEAKALEIIARAMCETMGEDADEFVGDLPCWQGYATHAYNAIAALEAAGFYFIPEVVQ